MRIVKIIGGLGNQMFQYALYLALRHQFPDEPVKADLHPFRGYQRHQGFEISRIFQQKPEAATWRETARLAYPYPNYTCWRIGNRVLPRRKTMLCEMPTMAYEPSALTRDTDTYYDGYWQHEAYFQQIRDDIVSTYQFPDFSDGRNQETARRILSTNSVAVHIRRGDYVRNSLYQGICGLDYYQRAIRRLRETTEPELYCLFSDDIAWCEKNILPLLDKPCILVGWNVGSDSFQDMHLMTLCKHHLIANSSFSWWGAWLCQHPGKTVIGPARWLNINNAASPMAEGWIQI